MITGSSKNAAQKRYKRLKDKIEGALNSGGAGTPTAAPATTQTSATRSNKKTTGPRKRKQSEVKEEEEESNAGVPQVDGADDTSPRHQTRGKSLIYDLSASFFSDDDLSEVSFERGIEKGDADYVFNPTTARSEDDNDPLFGSESSTRPNFKRLKKAHPSDFVDRLNAPMREIGETVVTPGPKPLKHGKPISRKTAAPANEKDLSSKTLFASRYSKMNMPVSQQPLPSIEHSPPQTPIPVSSAKKQQSVTGTDSDIDIKSLRPGALLTFPSKRQSQLSTSAIQKPLVELERFSTPITIASSESSSHDAAGKALKQNLAEHVEQIELRPEDSISNAGVRIQEDAMPTPVTQKGKHLGISMLRFVLLCPEC